MPLICLYVWNQCGRYCVTTERQLVCRMHICMSDFVWKFHDAFVSSLCKVRMHSISWLITPGLPSWMHLDNCICFFIYFFILKNMYRESQINLAHFTTHKVESAGFEEAFTHNEGVLQLFTLWNFQWKNAFILLPSSNIQSDLKPLNWAQSWGALWRMHLYIVHFQEYGLLCHMPSCWPGHEILAVSFLEDRKRGVSHASHVSLKTLVGSFIMH